jgi:hypothetical protein
MKAQIYINRHVVNANKKATAEAGEIVDNAVQYMRRKFSLRKGES